MNIKSLLSSLVLISVTIASETAFAECKTVMGGCLPAESIADVPTHMKSQIVNKVVYQKAATTAAPIKTSSNINANNKKTSNTTLALANNTK